MENKPEILDLDAIRPQKRYFKLSGKQIDITIMPFDVILDIAENMDKFQALNQGEAKGEDLKIAMKLLYNITLKVCKNADSEINEEWLTKNADIMQMIALMQFIIKPLLEKVGDSKNFLTVEPEKKE